jgi:hypothetical protein
MAARQLSPEKLQEIRDLAAGWGKIVARRVFGDDGPGLDVDITAMEQVAAAAAAGLTEGTFSSLLHQQAAALPDEYPCPDCQLPARVHSEDRPLHVPGGHQVLYHEPFCHCPDCRRDFFPPTPRPAPGRP